MTEAQLREMVKGLLEESLTPLRESQGNALAALLQRTERIESSSRDDKDKALGLGRVVRALVAGRGDPVRAAAWAKEKWQDEVTAKSLVTNVGASGGFLVPEELSSEVIELLRARAVVRSLQPTMVPMPNGTLTLPKHTAGAAAEYVGEATAQNATQPSVGQLRLVWKKLRATVPVSNELLAFSGPSADQLVRDDLVAALATREDQAFIRDDGTQDRPKGLRYWAPTASPDHVVATAGTSLANVRTDLRRKINALQSANVRMIRPAWIMSPRTFNYMSWDLTDGNGNLVFQEQLSRGRLNNWPVGVTTNVPDNLGGGGNESELYLVDMADAIIGEASQIEVVVSNEASYTDSGGNLVSAFDRDETVVKVISRHDFGMRHDASVHVTTGIAYGA